MLTNAYLLAKIGADTAENEQHFAEILPIGPRTRSGPRSGAVDEDEQEGRLQSTASQAAAKG